MHASTHVSVGEGQLEQALRSSSSQCGAPPASGSFHACLFSLHARTGAGACAGPLQVRYRQSARNSRVPREGRAPEVVRQSDAQGLLERWKHAHASEGRLEVKLSSVLRGQRIAACSVAQGS